jgi:hypothetical protein
MRKIIGLFSLVFIFTWLTGCQQVQHGQEASSNDNEISATGNFGGKISAEGALAAADLPDLFIERDTIETKLYGHIAASCKHSGCWMELDMGGQDILNITFQDEAFTIPLDAAGKNAVVKGIAFREIIPVETLRNYAREDGKSVEEIAMITEPEWKYEFIATGVIIEE